MSEILNGVDLDQVKLKIYEKLKPSGWGDKLKTFIMSDDFSIILKYLLKDAREGKRFTPQLKQVFRAFEECPYDKLKVVMMGQDPYPYAGVADGISFSGANINKVEASLRYMFQEVQEQMYPDGGYVWDPDLKRWSNQGILMLNVAFTTTINKVGTHYLIWQPFLAFLFDVLAFQNSSLIYVFLGKKAQEWAESVPDNNWKLFASHPASAAHMDAEKWNSDQVFKKTSDLVYKAYKEKIIW